MSIDEERLISKKEVLEKTGISYGQLYRWKRKGLIPESWFFRRSTFTGQETFFPRDKIIERIEQIKKMKGSRPLDDLAEMITDLDPNFIGAYKLSALVITEDLGNFAAAKNLMEKGLKYNPDDYWLTFEMGFLHFLEGRDYKESEKYFRVAATLPNSDGNRAARFAADAASKGGNIEASIALWNEMAENGDNRYIRELAERYIAKLEAQGAQQHGGGI